MKAIILAGGKGTRLSVLSKNIPKSMVVLANKPLIEYQIELLKKYRITDITIVTNYLGHIIQDYFKDGKKFGVTINYFEEKIPLGTAGSIGEITRSLQEDFLLLYGDLLININIQNLIKFHYKNGGLGTLVAHPNNHPFDSDLLEINKKNRIISIQSKPHKKDLLYHNLVNAAIYILSPRIGKYIPKGKSSDFGQDIFPTVVSKKLKLNAYKTHEYIKDVGTIHRLKEAEEDIKKQTYQFGNIDSRKPAIFFDRDGVINKEVDNISKVEDVVLLRDAYKALKRVNNSRFLAIVVSNQPQAAKGFCSVNAIENINKKIETLLGNKNAKIDALYLCLHHPEKGFPGENKKYKIICQCRKPNIGMIKKAVKELNIDLKKSYFIGDTTRDALTAQNAKISFIGVRTGYGCKDNKYDVKIGLLVNDINQAVNSILK